MASNGKHWSRNIQCKIVKDRIRYWFAWMKFESRSNLIVWVKVKGIKWIFIQGRKNLIDFEWRSTVLNGFWVMVKCGILRQGHTTTKFELRPNIILESRSKELNGFWVKVKINKLILSQGQMLIYQSRSYEWNGI